MRIDKVFEKLQQLSDYGAVSTQQLADALGLSRANVSNDLNCLVTKGKVEKLRGKPVRYLAIAQERLIYSNTYYPLDRFSDDNPSLFSAIEQAKAAVLYPPNGMNILILGETGVGKSMFAELIYEYVQSLSLLEQQAKFIIFNCADYSNNPQLLLAQLFGCKKGTYTGANEDRAGLIEKADNGILFLDEVHRLSPEGQEIFFTFIDKGIYHRLGESDVSRKARVRIIAATTEDPELSLLRTFSRRFPMTIKLPTLKERTFQERFNLVKHFFNNEAAHLGEDIVVSVNSLRALLSYPCLNNIGQLKSDIRFTCAVAYAKSMSGEKKRVEINSNMLPSYISEALFMAPEHRFIWNKMIGINRNQIIFSGKAGVLQFIEPQSDDIYEMLHLRVLELKSQGLAEEQLEDEIEKEITDYFQNHIHVGGKHFDLSKLENIISAKALVLTKEIIRYSQNYLQRPLNKKVYYGLATHIQHVIERGKKSKKITHPQLNKIRVNNPQEFNLALDCLKIIERVMDMTLSIEESGYLAMFFIYSDYDLEQAKRDVQIIVVAHGTQTATALVDTANSLLEVDYAVGFNVPLHESAQSVLQRIIHYLTTQHIHSDVLLLVDMGSLTAFGEAIENHCGLKTRTVQLISTLHIIEAIQSAMNGLTLDDVYQEVLNVNLLLGQNNKKSLKEQAIVEKKLAIVTLCSTGDGSARIMHNMLMRSLSYRKNILDIIPIALDDDIYLRLREIESSHNIVVIISPFNLNVSYAQFDLESILHQTCIDKIQTLIDVETVYILTQESLEEILTHIDGKQLLIEIKKFNHRMTEKLAIIPSTNILVGLIMHIAYLFERLQHGQDSYQFPAKQSYMQQHHSLIKLLRSEVQGLEHTLNLTIPDDELCTIAKFFVR